jgi:ABC-type phosphate/phosphonate transport system ATPase subunit
MLDTLPIGTKDENWFQEKDSIFTIQPETRRKHLAMFGATGAGKSTLLRNMIAWDISAGAGVSVIQLGEPSCNRKSPRQRRLPARFSRDAG